MQDSENAVKTMNSVKEVIIAQSEKVLKKDEVFKEVFVFIKELIKLCNLFLCEIGGLISKDPVEPNQSAESVDRGWHIKPNEWLREIGGAHV